MLTHSTSMRLPSHRLTLVVLSCLGLLFSLPGLLQAAAAQSTLAGVLHTFPGGAAGAVPLGGLVADDTGTLYGTTFYGGTGACPSGCGVVFALSPAGQATILHDFTGADGAWPVGGLVRDAAGTLYGITLSGGAHGRGVVYQISAAGVYTVVHHWDWPTGTYPRFGLMRAADGTLYGTTLHGGAHNAGVVFQVMPSGTLTVLHHFAGPEGRLPMGPLVRAADGTLYGTTYGGGDADQGVVFQLSPTGTYTVLHSFSGHDGAYPLGGLVRDSDGTLYGTTSYGGLYQAHGVVFQLTVAGVYTVLHDFYRPDGSAPMGALVRDAAGTLYGTTVYGGPSGQGIVYQLDAAGNFTVLHRFTAMDGAHPEDGVMRDAAGNLFVSTAYGGAQGQGVVVQLVAPYTVLHHFTGGAGGGSPNQGLVRDDAGTLYGTTNSGGASNQGVVFQLSPTGVYTVLYSFTGGADGRFPNGGLVRDTAGTLYGTTNAGGTSGEGVVFQLSTTGVYTVLHAFTGGAEGGSPNEGLVRDTAGALYGTTSPGGTSGQVFRLSATGVYTVLHAFTGGAEGGNPNGRLVRDTAGTLYGTTALGGTADHGVVYSLSATGAYSVLHAFAGGADGLTPLGGVVRDATGTLYGTTALGGTSGVVYSLSATGVYTVLFTFTGGTVGEFPFGELVRDAAGTLYGIAGHAAMSPGYGVAYSLSATGVYTVLHSFTAGASDGYWPRSGLVRDAEGTLYGTAAGGGADDQGVVFKLLSP